MPAVFSLGVDESSAQPVSYQWYVNTVSNSATGTPIADATNAGYRIPAVVGPAPSYFYVTAENCVNTATSSVALLQVTYLPVQVTEQPQDVRVLAGENAALAVEVSGTAPQLQWFKGDLPLADATNLALVLTNLQASDSGYYHALVSNATSVAVSRDAMVAVKPAPSVLIPWNYAWRYDQTGDCPDANWTQPVYPEEMSWPEGPGVLAYEPSPVIPQRIGTTLSLTNSSGAHIRTYYFRTHFTVTDDPAILTITTTNQIDDGCVVYLNGMEVYRINMNSGATSCTTLAPGAYGEGTMDVIDLPSALLVPGDNVLAAEVHQVNDVNSDVVFGFSAVANYPFPSPLVITQQPQSIVVEELKPAQLTVGYTGAPAWIQWYRQSDQGPAPVPFGNRATLTFTNAAYDVDEGAFFVVLSNSINQVTSSVAGLVIEQDLRPPAVFDADGTTNPYTVLLSFTEPVLTSPAAPALSVTNPENYTLTNTFGEELAIVSAVFTNENQRHPDQRVASVGGTKLPGHRANRPRCFPAAEPGVERSRPGGHAHLVDRLRGFLQFCSAISVRRSDGRFYERRMVCLRLRSRVVGAAVVLSRAGCLLSGIGAASGAWSDPA